MKPFTNVGDGRKNLDRPRNAFCLSAVLTPGRFMLSGFLPPTVIHLFQGITYPVPTVLSLFPCMAASIKKKDSDVCRNKEILKLQRDLNCSETSAASSKHGSVYI